MGLFTGLLTLPLAPVRGVAWLADQLAVEAARELEGDEVSLFRELSELQRAEAFGELTPDEYEAREEALIAQLARLRRQNAGGDGAQHSADTHGGTPT